MRYFYLFFLWKIAKIAQSWWLRSQTPQSTSSIEKSWLATGYNNVDDGIWKDFWLYKALVKLWESDSSLLNEVALKKKLL